METTFQITPPPAKQKDPYAVILGERIRQARMMTDPPVKQEEVAQHVSVGKAAVSAWEVGKNSPSPSDLMAIAKLFNVSLDWLFDYEPKTPLVRNVALVAKEALALWSYRKVLGRVQAARDYRSNEAMAVLVDFNSPLPDVAVPGDYLVILKTTAPKSGAPVFVLEESTNVPVLRRYIKEGNRELFMADDGRFPTVEGPGARILGQVTESIRRTEFI